jgi:hypothetical protein
VIRLVGLRVRVEVEVKQRKEDADPRAAIITIRSNP